MKRFLFLAFLSWYSQVFADKTIIWYEGSVVLRNKEVLTGEISVQALYDLIMFRSGEKVIVLPAHKIQSFYYYDAGADINRKFISLTNNESVFRTDNLYEIVLRGDVSVLRKQKKKLPAQQINVDRDGYDYFVKRNDRLTPLMRFKKEIFPELLKGYRQEILSFIHESRLSLSQPAHVIQIIQFYNKQTLTKQVIAMN